MSYQRTEISLNFIDKLSEEQKIAFLKAFVHLARLNGQIDEVEKEFIVNVARLYGIDKEHKDEILRHDTDENVLQEVAKIKDRRAGLELIKEMCMLAHADEVLTDAETLFIGRVGKAMNIEPQRIAQISRWVVDRIIWMEEAKLIFEEE